MELLTAIIPAEREIFYMFTANDTDLLLGTLIIASQRSLPSANL